MSSEEMEIVQVRELSYDDAKKEIIEYAENAGNRRVYISEVVEKLRLDIELVEKVILEWRDHKCKDLCEDDGFNRNGTSYTCPVTGCVYNNYLSR